MLVNARSGEHPHHTCKKREKEKAASVEAAFLFQLVAIPPQKFPLNPDLIIHNRKRLQSRGGVVE
jgi:hypothetical protein